MTTPTLDADTLPVLNGAHRDYLEDRAAAVTVGNALKVAVILLTLLALTLGGVCLVVVTRYADLKPLVIRIDELGQAKALSYDAASVYMPREPELRHHLRVFAEHYLSRERATLARDYPKALPFLKRYMLGTLNQRDTQKVLDTFRDTPSAPDVQVTVTNVVLSELVAQPFKAGIVFERRTLTAGTVQLRGEPETVTAQVDFEVLGLDGSPTTTKVPAWVRQENPLAIAVTDIRVSEPFR